VTSCNTDTPTTSPITTSPLSLRHPAEISYPNLLLNEQNMPRRANLPKDNHRAIDVFAKAAATSITEQLRQATNVIHQNAGDHMSTPNELESYLDITLTGVFGREPIQMLGMSKPVVLAIGQPISKSLIINTLTMALGADSTRASLPRCY
jgi:hypothetical protein